MDLMDIRRTMMGVIAGMARTGKRFVSGTVDITDNRTEIAVPNVPFVPSFAVINVSGDVVSPTTYNTIYQLFIASAVNNKMTTGVQMFRYDCASDTAPRLTQSYNATMPIENETFTFSARGASFPFAQGTYEYMIVE